MIKSDNYHIFNEARRGDYDFMHIFMCSQIKVPSCLNIFLGIQKLQIMFFLQAN